MNNDKEKSAIDKFKETVSDAVGNLASIVTPSLERPKKVAATTNEQVYIPEAADAAAMPAPLFANRVRKRKTQATKKSASSAKKAAKQPVKKTKTKSSTRRKAAAKKRPVNKFKNKKKKSKR
jgi:hypothetical protein